MIVRTHYEVGQTALTIVCDERYLKTVKDAVFDTRSIIESKISEDPFFGITYDPYPVSKEDHPLIQRMCQASELSSVGPMAGVAGAVSESAVRAAVDEGCDHIIVENGGDIALYIEHEVRIGIFSGSEKFGNLALLVPPRKNIFGICSSSGMIGPSVSFGKSAICTVFSDDTILADCSATAFGNMLKTGDKEEMVSSAESICSIEGVNGCLSIFGSNMAVCGDIPELVEGRFDSDLLTNIRL